MNISKRFNHYGGAFYPIGVRDSGEIYVSAICFLPPDHIDTLAQMVVF